MRNVTYINAGAGSGKTYTLTKILAEKLSKKEVKPSEVILTTFTELAAAEFKEKARQQILSTDNMEVASQMDCAAIGTVHSVALGFIKEFWFLLEYGADIQTISERDEDFYMSQSLARIASMPEHKSDLDNFRKFREFFDILDSSNHPDHLFWQQHLNSVVEKMEYYGVDVVDISTQKSIETLRAVYTGTPVDYNFIASALKEYGNFCATKFDDGRSGTKAHEHYDAVAKLLHEKRDQDWLTRVKTLMKTPCCEKAAEQACTNFTNLKDQLSVADTSVDALAILEPFVKSVFRLAKVWHDDFIAYKRNNHIISYNDMEQIFLRLLTDYEEVQDYVRSHYRLVMVDEFQDSNPIQLKIFNKLSEIIAETDGHSYWVGDPKQAIYGFRGADTDLVNSVANHFTFYDDAEIHEEEGPRNLATGRLVESWRSRKKLVDLVNAVFYEPFKNDGINKLCIKLDAHFKNDDNVNSNAIVHWECDDSLKNQQDAADALVFKVKELLESKIQVHSGKRDEPATAISPRDVAILCRKNSACKEVVKALRKYGIPVSEAEDAIMQRIEVQLVVTLLQFMQDPKNKHVFANLMRLLWGNTTEKILRNRIDYVLEHTDSVGEFDTANDNWQDDLEPVKDLLKQRQRIQHLSIPEMVKAIIYESNIPSLTARWGDEQVRRQNLSTLQHLADDYDEMCLQMGLGTSISGFIYYLNSIEPDKEKDNKSDTVKVFTYHGSKGLEWPVVVMHGLGENVLTDADFTKKSFMKVREVVMNDNATEEDPFAKEYYLHFFPFTLSSFNNNPTATLQDNINELEFYKKLKERTKSEERRLLYVGMTRAKDYLYTFGYKGNFDWLTNAGVESPSSDNVWGNSDYAVTPISISKPEDSKEDSMVQTYTIIEKPIAHNERERKFLSPSKIKEFSGYFSHESWKEKGTVIETKGWNKDNYATIGTCIHDIFAIYRQGHDEDNRKKALSIIGGYGLSDILAGHVDAILRSAYWLYNQLQQHFPQTEGDSICNEYPFEMTLPTGQHLRGEMDLLWFYTDDKGHHCVLIDYKTFGGVALNEHTTTHYAQLSAYAEALRHKGIDVAHALIYYPVYSTIHELK